MLEPDLTHLISLHPDRGELPIACVKAVCLQESAFNEWAVRYEPSFKWLVGMPDTLTATERTCQMISWGLMQVMGAVAREHGFTNPLPKLCDPYTGLRYGMLHVRKFYDKYQNWPDTLSSYNAGSPRKNTEGKYLNQQYVDSVLRHWAKFEKQIPFKESEA